MFINLFIISRSCQKTDVPARNLVFLDKYFKIETGFCTWRLTKHAVPDDN